MVVINKKWASFAILVCIVGAAICIYGLVETGFPSSLPWSAGGGKRYSLYVVISLLSSFFLLQYFKIPFLKLVIVSFFLIAAVGHSLWALIVALTFFSMSTFLGMLVIERFGVAEKATNYIFLTLVGAGVYGTAVGILAHYEVNYYAVYLLMLIMPVLLNFKQASQLFQNIYQLYRKNVEFRHASMSDNFLHSVVSSLMLVYLVVAMMPELGSDALAMHLFTASKVSTEHYFSFDTTLYSWSVMPMLGDWIFAIGYMLGGETSVRFINVGFLIILLSLLVKLMKWAGASNIGITWGKVIFLSTPLVFNVASLSYIDTIWTAYTIAATLLVLEIVSEKIKVNDAMIYISFFLGFSVAGKLLALTFIPGLFVIFVAQYKIWVNEFCIRTFILSVVIFLLLASPSYLTALYLTGNPVFPFYNALFKSSQFPDYNFMVSPIHHAAFTYDLIYQAIFNPKSYLTGSVGGAGFQWLILLFPSVIFSIFVKNKRAFALFFLALIGFLIVYSQVSYFRYIFPVYVLGIAFIVSVLFSTKVNSKGFEYAVILFFFLSALLNMLFLNSATHLYYDFDPRVVLSDSRYQTYKYERAPIRRAVDTLNGLNVNKSPVVFLTLPLTAGIQSDVLYTNYYNHKFGEKFLNANNTDLLSKLFRQYKAKYIVLDETMVGSQVIDIVNEITNQVAKFGRVSIRVVKDEYRFYDNLLYNDKWTLSGKKVSLDEVYELGVTVKSSAIQKIAVEPKRSYRYKVRAYCANVKGRLQVNWLDSKSMYIGNTIHVFSCTDEAKDFYSEMVAPEGALYGIVVLTSHTNIPVYFNKAVFLE